MFQVGKKYSIIGQFNYRNPITVELLEVNPILKTFLFKILYDNNAFFNKKEKVIIEISRIEYFIPLDDID